MLVRIASSSTHPEQSQAEGVVCLMRFSVFPADLVGTIQPRYCDHLCMSLVEAIPRLLQLVLWHHSCNPWLRRESCCMLRWYRAS